MTNIKRIAIAVLTSWWFIGALGWIIVVENYPIDGALPTYAE